MAELKKDSPEKSYMIKAEIARGKYAVVKKCNERKTRKQYAAKLIKYDDEPSKVMAVREFQIWSGLKNDKIVMAREGFILHKYVVVIMDFFEMKDCLSYLAEKPRASEEDAAGIIRQLLEALKYLHSQNVIHLDIRPANVCMLKDNTLKLIDFGCARKIGKMETGELVDAIAVAEFTAPELLNFDPTSWGADMWSVGVLVYIFMGGVLPFTADDEDEVKALVSAVDYEFGAEFKRTSAEAKDFIKHLLLRIPEKRSTAAQSLELPWLKPNNVQRRKQSEIPAKSFAELNQKLMDDEKDELIVASCVLRTLSEEPYDSPEEDEE